MNFGITKSFIFSLKYTIFLNNSALKRTSDNLVYKLVSNWYKIAIRSLFIINLKEILKNLLKKIITNKSENRTYPC